MNVEGDYAPLTGSREVRDICWRSSALGRAKAHRVSREGVSLPRLFTVARPTMQKLFLGALALLLIAAPAVSAQTYSGSILVGHAVTGLAGGATEIFEACTPDGELAGVDGVWFDIGTGDNRTFALTMDSTLDADVYFYDAGCSYISDYSGAQNFLGEAEAGIVPEGARFAIVDGFAGTGAFELTIS